MLGKKLVPSLRFPEFSEAWEENKLSNICKMNPKGIVLPNKFMYIDLESVTSGSLNKDIKIIDKSDAPSRAQRILEKEDILYQTVRPYQRNNFYFNLKLGIAVVASTGYAQLRCTNNSNKFVFQLLHTDNFVNKVLVRCTGTSYPAINLMELASISTLIPSITEQEKIACFFDLFDNKVKKQEEKITILNEYKRSMTQKIFSKTIRFKDENGQKYPEWNKQLLGDVAEIKTGNSNVQDSIKDGKYNFFDRSTVIKKLNKYDFDEEAIIYPGEGSNFYPKYYKGKYALHQRAYSITSNKINMRYLNYMLMLRNNHFLKTAVGSTVKSLRMNNFIECPIYIPVKEEQNKITNFLYSIDFKIEKEKEKLDSLKELKNGLIQKMFI